MYGVSEIKSFEKHFDLPDKKAYAKVLGLAYTTYIEYKNEKRPIEKRRIAPDYVLYAIQVLQALPKSKANKLLKSRLASPEIDVDTETYLENFERKIGLGAAACADLLGLSFSSYSQYKTTRAKSLPKYHIYHAESLVLLNGFQFRKCMDVRLDLHKLKNYTRAKINKLQEITHCLFSDSALADLVGITVADFEKVKDAEVLMSPELEACIKAHSLLKREVLSDLAVKRAAEGYITDSDVRAKALAKRLDVGISSFKEVFLGIAGKQGFDEVTNTVKATLEVLTDVHTRDLRDLYNLD